MGKTPILFPGPHTFYYFDQHYHDNIVLATTLGSSKSSCQTGVGGGGPFGQRIDYGMEFPHATGRATPIGGGGDDDDALLGIYFTLLVVYYQQAAIQESTNSVAKVFYYYFVDGLPKTSLTSINGG